MSGSCLHLRSQLRQRSAARALKARLTEQARLRIAWAVESRILSLRDFDYANCAALECGFEHGQSLVGRLPPALRDTPASRLGGPPGSARRASLFAGCEHRSTRLFSRRWVRRRRALGADSRRSSPRAHVAPLRISIQSGPTATKCSCHKSAHTIAKKRMDLGQEYFCVRLAATEVLATRSVSQRHPDRQRYLERDADPRHSPSRATSGPSTGSRVVSSEGECRCASRLSYLPFRYPAHSS